jgi:putative FmdB family regulatory protein
MPTYEYACRKCKEHLEVVQSFNDEALTECPACGGPLRKVFGNIGIAFKGSGFYKNDSRQAQKSESGSGSKTDTKSSETKADTKSGDTKSGTSGDTKSTETKSDSKSSEKSSDKSSPKAAAS